MRNHHPITLILSRRLVTEWAELYELLGYGSVIIDPEVVPPSEETLERLAMVTNPVALEWQPISGARPMLRMMFALKIDCPVLLYQNLVCCSESKARSMGYRGVIPAGGDMTIEGEFGATFISPFPPAHVFQQAIANAFLDHASNKPKPVAE